MTEAMSEHYHADSCQEIKETIQIGRQIQNQVK